LTGKKRFEELVFNEARDVAQSKEPRSGRRGQRVEELVSNEERAVAQANMAATMKGGGRKRRLNLTASARRSLKAKVPKATSDRTLRKLLGLQPFSKEDEKAAYRVFLKGRSKTGKGGSKNEA